MTGITGVTEMTGITWAARMTGTDLQDKDE